MDLCELVEKNWPAYLNKPNLKVFDFAAFQRGHAYGQKEVDIHFIDYVNMYLEAIFVTHRFDYNGDFLYHGFN